MNDDESVTDESITMLRAVIDEGIAELEGGLSEETTVEELMAELRRVGASVRRPRLDVERDRHGIHHPARPLRFLPVVTLQEIASEVHEGVAFIDGRARDYGSPDGRSMLGVARLPW